MGSWVGATPLQQGRPNGLPNPQCCTPSHGQPAVRDRLARGSSPLSAAQRVGVLGARVPQPPMGAPLRVRCIRPCAVCCASSSSPPSVAHKANGQQRPSHKAGLRAFRRKRVSASRTMSMSMMSESPLDGPGSGLSNLKKHAGGVCRWSWCVTRYTRPGGVALEQLWTVEEQGPGGWCWGGVGRGWAVCDGRDGGL